MNNKTFIENYNKLTESDKISIESLIAILLKNPTDTIERSLLYAKQYQCPNEKNHSKFNSSQTANALKRYANKK